MRKGRKRMMTFPGGMWRILALANLVILVALQGCTTPQAPPSQVTPDAAKSLRVESGMPVYPPSLADAPAMELGQLVLMLLPPLSNPTVYWDFAANSPIQWIDDGVREERIGTKYKYFRSGLVRVNVNGQWASVLKQRKSELAWTVQYYADATPKFGPQTIEIMPGLYPMEQCFGVLFDNCDFQPKPSIIAAGITITPLCREREGGADFIEFMQLNARGKAPMVAGWMQSVGSGGESDELTLYPKETAASICKREK